MHANIAACELSLPQLYLGHPEYPPMSYNLYHTAIWLVDFQVQHLFVLLTHPAWCVVRRRVTSNPFLRSVGLHRMQTKTFAVASPPASKHQTTISHPVCRTTAPAAKRTISLEARAAPPTAAPKGPGSTARSVVARGSSNGANANGSSQEAASPSTPSADAISDVFQSAEDDLDPEDTVRAKSHAQVSYTVVLRYHCFCNG